MQNNIKLIVNKKILKKEYIYIYIFFLVINAAWKKMRLKENHLLSIFESRNQGHLHIAKKI